MSLLMEQFICETYYMSLDRHCTTGVYGMKIGSYFLGRAILNLSPFKWHETA